MKKIIMAAVILAIGMTSFAQKNKTVIDENGKEIKLKNAYYELVVNATLEEAWAALAQYGNVGDFHSSVSKSHYVSADESLDIGCERYCEIPNGKKTINIKERIIEIEQGAYYQYDVYEWENFPLKKMLVTWGVKQNEQGQTVMYNSIDYRLKPSILTGMMRGKMKKNARDGLISYKHHIETRESNVATKELRKKYREI